MTNNVYPEPQRKWALSLHLLIYTPCMGPGLSSLLYREETEAVNVQIPRSGVTKLVDEFF